MTTGWSSSVTASAKPIQPVALTTSAQQIYQAPAVSGNIQAGFATSELNSLTVTNTTTGALTFTVYIVPSGGTTPPSGQTNAWATAVPISANDTKAIPLPEVLAAGDTIWALASGTGLNIRGSVSEVQ